MVWRSFLRGVFLMIAIGSVVGAEADVLTVGIGGTYGTIQDAIAAAVSMGGDNTLKLRAGTFDETVGIPTSMNSGSLYISGGWSVFFVYQDDPSATVINSSLNTPGSSQTVSIMTTGGSVTFDNLTITDGNASGDGGGVYIGPDGTAQVAFRHCIIRDNTTSGRGGGVFLSATDTVAVEFEDCSIRQNHVQGNLYDILR